MSNAYYHYWIYIFHSFHKLLSRRIYFIASLPRIIRVVNTGGILSSLGENLFNMITNLCTEVGIDWRYTNHSLRATVTSELFQSGTTEHVIQQFTGHQSLQALCQYENISTKQKQTACNILTGSFGRSFSFKVQKFAAWHAAIQSCFTLFKCSSY